MSKKNTDNLKKCHKCGKEPMYMQYDIVSYHPERDYSQPAVDTHGTVCGYYCPNCTPMGEYPTKQAAIEAWNKRCEDGE